MTVYVHRFFCVPAAHKAVAKELVTRIANSVAAGSAVGMFESACSATGLAPATDWVASGPIDSQFAALLGNAAATFGAYQQVGGATITLAQVQALYTACPLGTRIRSDLDIPNGGQSGLTALGLKLVETP